MVQKTHQMDLCHITSTSGRWSQLDRSEVYRVPRLGLLFLCPKLWQHMDELLTEAIPVAAHQNLATGSELYIES